MVKGQKTKTTMTTARRGEYVLMDASYKGHPRHPHCTTFASSKTKDPKSRTTPISKHDSLKYTKGRDKTAVRVFMRGHFVLPHLNNANSNSHIGKSNSNRPTHDFGASKT